MMKTAYSSGKAIQPKHISDVQDDLSFDHLPGIQTSNFKFDKKTNILSIGMSFFKENDIKLVPVYLLNDYDIGFCITNQKTKNRLAVYWQSDCPEYYQFTPVKEHLKMCGNLKVRVILGE